ncbi:hypothetical protein, partial [Prevotellamassilia timonensis]|uniref:hypothetical protein n=1 Tax=Prevotellamassilia timonensis TaxID=1852370 RepID=UPI00307907F0
MQNKKVFFCFQFRTAAYFGGEKLCKVSEVQNKNMEYSYGHKYQMLPLNATSNGGDASRVGEFFS